MNTPLPGPPPDQADPVAEFEAEFLAAMERGDDFAVREQLAAGYPVCYVEDDTPEGLVIIEYPDGQRELTNRWGKFMRVIYKISPVSRALS